MKHTKGPWEFKASLFKDAQIWVPGAEEFIYIRIENPKQNKMSEIAHLISCAPEMLEALERVYLNMQMPNPIMLELDRLIKKAKGDQS